MRAILCKCSQPFSQSKLTKAQSIKLDTEDGAVFFYILNHDISINLLYFMFIGL